MAHSSWASFSYAIPVGEAFTDTTIKALAWVYYLEMTPEVRCALEKILP
jgi:hypothetical protein